MPTSTTPSSNSWERVTKTWIFVSKSHGANGNNLREIPSTIIGGLMLENNHSEGWLTPTSFNMNTPSVVYVALSSDSAKPAGFSRDGSKCQIDCLIDINKAKIPFF